MSLQRAKELITEAGQLVAEEGLSSPEYGEFLFEAVAGLLIAKKALQREGKQRARRDFDRAEQGLSTLEWGGPINAGTAKFFEEQYGWRPDDSGDSGTLPDGGGVAGRTEGSLQVPGATQAHSEEPPQ